MVKYIKVTAYSISLIVLFICVALLYGSQYHVEKKVKVEEKQTEQVKPIENVIEMEPIPIIESNQKNSEERLLVNDGNKNKINIDSDNRKEIVINNQEKKSNKGKEIPVLYYHAVDDNIWGNEELFVSPVEFEKQMKYLKQNSYNVITFDELDNVKNIENPVIITLDDGYEDNYTYAYPILKKYNFKATIFLITDAVDKDKFLKINQIKEMRDILNFQSHTITHPILTKIKEKELEYELKTSKEKLEALTGEKVNGLAYPEGYYNQKVIDKASKYYKYAVISGGGMHYENDGNYEIRRIYIPRELNIEGFKKKLTQ